MDNVKEFILTLDRCSDTAFCRETPVRISKALCCGMEDLLEF